MDLNMTSLGSLTVANLPRLDNLLLQPDPAAPNAAKVEDDLLNLDIMSGFDSLDSLLRGDADSEDQVFPAGPTRAESPAKDSVNVFDMAGNLTDIISYFNSNNTNDGIEKLLEDFTNNFNDEKSISELAFNTLMCLYGIVICLGTIGNTVILYAILSKRNMRTARNYFIVNLAISDLLLCCMTMPLTLWEVLSRKWPFGENLQWLCQLAHSCQGTPIFLSSMAIVAIAVDRYRCIMQPDRPHFSSKAALAISLMMTMLAVFFTVPMFVTAEIKHFIEMPDTVNIADILICQDTWKGSSKILYTVMTSLAQYVLPVILVISFYLSIYMKLRNRPQSQHAENNEKRRRTNRMILCIALIFFISWLPLNIFNIFMDLHPSLMKPLIAGKETVVYAVLHLFGLCNALTNPILYGYLNENFRKEYKYIYRQMPWHSTSVVNEVEVSVHCRMVNRKKNKEGSGEVNKSSCSAQAAVVSIDNDNVRVVGPASIVQQLILAAASAAAAAPKKDSMASMGHNEYPETPDQKTAEAVATAFLKSVSSTAGDAANEDADGAGMDEDANPHANVKLPHINTKVYMDGKAINGFFPLDQQKLLMLDDDSNQNGDSDNNPEDMEVILVASRPRIVTQKPGRWMSRRLTRNYSIESHHRRMVQRFKRQQSTPGYRADVSLLNLEAFSISHQNGEATPTLALDESSGTAARDELGDRLSLLPRPCRKHRQYSIPNALLYATACREPNLCLNRTVEYEDKLTKLSFYVPRSRLASLVADKYQQRPVYCPKHPVDLEGLQETAV